MLPTPLRAPSGPPRSPMRSPPRRRSSPETSRCWSSTTVSTSSNAAAAVIDELVARCPKLSVLATSREPLQVDGEHVVAVRTLDPPTTGVELFKQRATAAGADLPEASDEIVEELCWRLDGIPLAIELAAARAATLGLATIVDTMDEMLDLRAGRDRAQDRHVTMRATIEWSFRLLSRDEQRMLAWLSVFPSGFALDAAIHVASSLGLPARVVTDHISTLVQKSMLSVEPDGHGHRYRLLETVRAFALEQLTAGDTHDAALHALAGWVTTHHRPAVLRLLQRRGRAQLPPPRAGSGQLARGGAVGGPHRVRRARGAPVRPAGGVLPARPARLRRRRPAAAGALRRAASTPGRPVRADRVDFRLERGCSPRTVGGGGRADRSARTDRARRPDALAGPGLAGRLRRVRSPLRRSLARRPVPRGDPRHVRGHRGPRPLQPDRRHRRHVRPHRSGRWRSRHGQRSHSCARRACSARRGDWPRRIPSGRCGWCARHARTSRRSRVSRDSRCPGTRPACSRSSTPTGGARLARAAGPAAVSPLVRGSHSALLRGLRPGAGGPPVGRRRRRLRSRGRRSRRTCR